MAEPKDNLEQQLDALVQQAQSADGGDANAAPQDAADAGTGDEDVVGAEFADQVQKMLDEAKSQLGDESADAGDAAAAEGRPSSAKPAESEEELIGQIDKMLADQADDVLEGQFESVDELLADEEPTDHAAEATAQAADDSALSEKAKAVGAELDADAAASGELASGGCEDMDEADDSDMQSIEEMFPDEDDPSSILEGSRSGVEEAVTPAKSQAQPQAPQHVSPVMKALRMLNRPLEGLPRMWRDVVGFCGFQTAGLAVIWISFLAGGAILGTLMLSAATVAGYFLFRKLFMC